MSHFIELLKALIFSQHQFRILHWKVATSTFDGPHGIFSEYVEKLDDCIDEVAEMMLAMGADPVTLKDCLNGRDELDVKENLSPAQAFAQASLLFTELIKLYSAARNADGCPEAFKSKLDDTQYYFIIENNYKCKRRLKNSSR